MVDVVAFILNMFFLKNLLQKKPFYFLFIFFYLTFRQRKNILPVFALLLSTVFSVTPALSDSTDKTDPSNSNLQTSASQHSGSPTHIAIIIDDIGYSFDRGKTVAMLPAALTLAIIPHTANSVKLANLAHQQGKEIILHVPMSNLLDKPLDKGALTHEMGYFLFRDTLKNNLQSVPHVVGINNHMGSLLTQQSTPMSWLMEILLEENLFFVDSKTSPETIAGRTAQSFGIPHAERHVFLDNERDFFSIARQFDAFIKESKTRGYGIAIAHPYPETLAFLAQILPKLPALDVRLVPVSHLLSSPKAPKSTYTPLPEARNDGKLDYFSPFSTLSDPH